MFQNLIVNVKCNFIFLPFVIFFKATIRVFVEYFFIKYVNENITLTFVGHFPKRIYTRGGNVSGERPHTYARPEQRLDGQTQTECVFRYSTHGADSFVPRKCKKKKKKLIIIFSTNYTFVL